MDNFKLMRALVFAIVVVSIIMAVMAIAAIIIPVAIFCFIVALIYVILVDRDVNKDAKY